MDDVMDWCFNWLLMPVMIVLLAALFLFIFVGIPALIYHAATTPPAKTFELRNDDWHCGQSKTTMITTYVMVGKVMVPVTNPVTECIAWVRNG